MITDFIPNMSFSERLRMRRQGRNFWAAYMSTKKRVLDTVMAVIRQRLGLEPPHFKVGIFSSLRSGSESKTKYYKVGPRLHELVSRSYRDS